MVQVNKGNNPLSCNLLLQREQIVGQMDSEGLSEKFEGCTTTCTRVEGIEMFSPRLSFHRMVQSYNANQTAIFHTASHSWNQGPNRHLRDPSLLSDRATRSIFSSNSDFCTFSQEPSPSELLPTSAPPFSREDRARGA